MKRSKNMMVILFLVYVCLSAGGLILFKLGSKDLSLNITTQNFDLHISWLMLLGILCYACSFVLWLLIVNSLDLSFAMPLSVGLVNVFVLFGSYMVLKENITLMQWLGTFIIIIGLFVINFGK